LLINRHFSNLTPLLGLNLQAADVNASQAVNATDALICSRRFSNIISSFGSGDWLWMPMMLQVQSGIQYPNLVMKGITFGDVNGSYVPNTAQRLVSSVELVNLFRDFRVAVGPGPVEGRRP